MFVFQELCTVARARGVCALVFAVIAAAIAPYHVLFIGVAVGYRYCAVLRAHEAAFYVLYVVEMFIFRLVPVAVITVLNDCVSSCGIRALYTRPLTLLALDRLHHKG